MGWFFLLSTFFSLYQFIIKFELDSVGKMQSFTKETQ